MRNSSRDEKTLGISRSTVYRELERNGGKCGGYDDAKAQANFRRQRFRLSRTYTIEIHRLLTPYIGRIRSITTDNGSEFAAHKLIAKRLHTTVYFAHPYSAWEKGAIENYNKLLRQYIPKKADINLYSQQQIKTFQKEINERPRGKPDFATPKREFFRHFT